jgi:uridylate kinase
MIDDLINDAIRRMDNGLPIYVFALADGNIRRVVLGERVGTIISTPSESGGSE